MPSCGQLVQYLRIVQGKICERLSTFPHLPASLHQKLVDAILDLPSIIPVFSATSAHGLAIYLPEASAHFSPLSTLPITTHPKKESKKGL